MLSFVSTLVVIVCTYVLVLLTGAVPLGAISMVIVPMMNCLFLDHFISDVFIHPGQHIPAIE